MIVTHTNPDMDAACGVWLLKRFGDMDNEPVEFVNTGNPDPDKLAMATAVVDTGRDFDPGRMRFDHHHLPGDESTDTCAALQVFEYLVSSRNKKIKYLKPLINLVLFGDTGNTAALESRMLGIHAVLIGHKAHLAIRGCQGDLADNSILGEAFYLLDNLEIRLRTQAESSAELHEKVVYRSDDDLIWAIRHGSQGSTLAAQERGARLVVFEGAPLEVEGGTTYPIGIIRTGEWQEPHVGNLAKLVAKNIEEFADEIKKWFCHPAGVFAGRGTAKAPVYERISIDLDSLAEAIDDAWWDR